MWLKALLVLLLQNLMPWVSISSTFDIEPHLACFILCFFRTTDLMSFPSNMSFKHLSGFSARNLVQTLPTLWSRNGQSYSANKQNSLQAIPSSFFHPYLGVPYKILWILSCAGFASWSFSNSSSPTNFK